MRPTKKERIKGKINKYTTDELLNKLDQMNPKAYRFFNQRNRETDKQTLAAFLYKINFITARKELEDGSINRKYFEENRYLSSSFVDFGFDWEVHPAYRWALQPDDISNIFNEIELSEE